MNSEIHLVAGCGTCGAPQPLTLSAEAGPCPHCGDVAPIDALLRRRLDDMRVQLSQRDATPRQLTAKALVAGDGLYFVGMLTIVICWALFGGIGLYVALDHDIPFREFLVGGKPASQWWLLWSIVLGVSLSVALLEAGVARIRGLGAEALPAPPAADGEQPRCRYCAAQLPIGTALRRCGFCKSDNLVVTGRYLRAERDVDRALDAIEARFDTNLSKRIDTGNTIAMAGGVGPFFLIFIGPAIGLMTPGDPSLWAVPAATILLAVIIAAVARVRRLPVDAIELLALGQKAYVREDASPERIVSAQLMLSSGPVSLLGSTAEDSLHAITASRQTGRLVRTVYRLEPGQRPLDESERAQLQTAELWRHNRDAAPTIERVRVLVESGGWRTFTGEDDSPHLHARKLDDPPVVVPL